MNNEIINLPTAFCTATLNGKYKKIVSESIIFDNEKDEGEFKFVIEYPKDNFTGFTVKVKFEKDNKEGRVLYTLDEDNDSGINMIIYNSDNTTIFCSMTNITNIGDKNFFIRPKIESPNDKVKIVTIGLYSN